MKLFRTGRKKRMETFFIPTFIPKRPKKEAATFSVEISFFILRFSPETSIPKIVDESSHFCE
jgi:hypothetical protein